MRAWGLPAFLGSLHQRRFPSAAHNPNAATSVQMLSSLAALAELNGSFHGDVAGFSCS